MALLVHLTAAKNAGRVVRVGIRPSPLGDVEGHRRGVFAMPVLPSYYASHQWLRELRRNQREIVAVDFRVPDDEPVLVGHYASEPLATSAAAAAGIVLRADDQRGYQLIVPRAISSKAVRRVRHVSQVVGWRYWPGAHGTAPCPCPVCLSRGSPGAQRIRRRFDDEPARPTRGALLRPLARKRRPLDIADALYAHEFRPGVRASALAVLAQHPESDVPALQLPDRLGPQRS